MATLPPLNNLLAQIQAALGPALPPSLTLASAGSDIFEAYVLSLILDAAETEGAIIGFANVDGSVPTQFKFRTSPGHIWWDSQPFTYATVQFPDAPLLEAHMGVYVSGKSGLIHEADVLVLLAEEADLARDNQVPPRSKRSIIATECKFYAANLQIGLARGFVGLCSDLSTRDCYFVSNAGSGSVEKLLTYHRKHWDSRLEPGTPIVVARFVAAIQSAFKQFKARYAV